MFTIADAPPQVRKAFVLLWASVLIGLAQTAFGIIFPEPEIVEFAGLLAAFLLLVSAVYVAVVFFASRRRNWARYFLLAWTLVGVGAYVAFLGEEPLSWRDDVPIIICTILEILALYWLFTGTGSEWYRDAAR